MPATVVALHLSTASRAPLTPRTQVTAVERHGLEGDRHSRPNSRRAVLLVEQEVLDRFALGPGDVREQVTVQGLDLCGLAQGTRLRIGGAVLELGGLCAPCSRMDELRSGLQTDLEGRRGRFVGVVQGGELSVGDSITVEASGS